MTAMRAGDLTRRITIERLTGVADAAGQPVHDDWEEVAIVWANVRHLSGTDSIKAGAMASVVAASIRIRYRADVLAGMRARLGAKAYKITAVLPDEARRQYLDLVCEVINGGL